MLYFMSEEAWFHLSGHINSQNTRYWSIENPFQLYEKQLIKSEYDVLLPVIVLCCQHFLTWLILTRELLLSTRQSNMTHVSTIHWPMFLNLTQKIKDTKTEIEVLDYTILLQVYLNMITEHKKALLHKELTSNIICKNKHPIIKVLKVLLLYNFFISFLKYCHMA